MKNIQISEHLFTSLVRYHLLDDIDQADTIKEALEQKLDAIVRHELYTKYKEAPTEEEREQARQAYLERRGIHQSFRW